MNKSPAAVRQGRWGWGTPLKETTTTGRDRCAKAGPCGQAPARLGLVTVPVAAQHIINIEVGHGAGSNSHAFDPYGVRRQADGMGLINRGLGFLTSGRVGKYWVAFPYGLLDCAAMELLQLTPAQLRQAASLKERMEELERELESLLGTSATATPSRKLHWTQTPAGRARLARSVRRSWRTRRRS